MTLSRSTILLGPQFLHLQSDLGQELLSASEKAWKLCVNLVCTHAAWGDMSGALSSYLWVVLFWSTGDWTQGLVHTKQVLYH